MKINIPNPVSETTPELVAANKKWVEMVMEHTPDETLWESTAHQRPDATLSIVRTHTGSFVRYHVEGDAVIEVPIGFSFIIEFVKAMGEGLYQTNRSFYVGRFVGNEQYHLHVGTVWLLRQVLIVRCLGLPDVNFLLDPENRPYLNSKERVHVMNDFKLFVVVGTGHPLSVSVPKATAESDEQTKAVNVLFDYDQPDEAK